MVLATLHLGVIRALAGKVFGPEAGRGRRPVVGTLDEPHPLVEAHGECHLLPGIDVAMGSAAAVTKTARGSFSRPLRSRRARGGVRVPGGGGAPAGGAGPPARR